MKNTAITFTISIIIVLSSCRYNTPKTKQTASPSKTNFPTVQKTRNLLNTIVVATMENNLPNNKNVLYCPTLLLAWEAVRKEILPQINNSNSADLLLLNNSTTYINSLKENEYQKNVKIEEAVINVNVSFNKSLEFPVVLDTTGSPMFFKTDSVLCFGMNYYSEKIADNIDLVYYKDDDHFILSVHTKEPNEKLLFAKGIDKSSNIDDCLNTFVALKLKGEEERKNDKLRQKYYLYPDDVVAIPVLKFNIEHDYPTLVDQTFASSKGPEKITKASQRTAFILTEVGAKVESVAEIEAVTAAAAPPPPPGENEIIKPKKLLLNKTFWIIIQKGDSKYPYFVLKVDNTELMVKSK